MTEGKNKTKPGESEQKMETHVEEDDEFEEFPQQDWQAKDGAEDEEVRIVHAFLCTSALKKKLQCTTKFRGLRIFTSTLNYLLYIEENCFSQSFFL